MCRAVLGSLSGVALLLVGFGLESLTGALLAGPILIVVIGLLCRADGNAFVRRRKLSGADACAERMSGAKPTFMSLCRADVCR